MLVRNFRKLLSCDKKYEQFLMVFDLVEVEEGLGRHHLQPRSSPLPGDPTDSSSSCAVSSYRRRRGCSPHPLLPCRRHCPCRRSSARASLRSSVCNTCGLCLIPGTRTWKKPINIIIYMLKRWDLFPTLQFLPAATKLWPRLCFYSCL